MTNKPYVVPSTARRDLFIGIAVGLVVLVGLYLAVSNMGRGVAANTVTGTIVSKSFVPLKEEQVTFGKKGVHAKQVDGEYSFEVHVGEKSYNVWVDKVTYESKKEGERFSFPPPK